MVTCFASTMRTMVQWAAVWPPTVVHTVWMPSSIKKSLCPIINATCRLSAQAILNWRTHGWTISLFPNHHGLYHRGSGLPSQPAHVGRLCQHVPKDDATLLGRSTHCVHHQVPPFL